MKRIESKSFRAIKKAMGSQILPPLNPSEYPDRSQQGLEGPFRQPSGHVLYYDPKEGKYYDPSTDMFVGNEEYEAMQRR